MAPHLLRTTRIIALIILGAGLRVYTVSAQREPTSDAVTAQAVAQQTSNTPDQAANSSTQPPVTETRAQRRAARRLAAQKRAAAAQQSATGSPAAQAQRDQKLLDQQQAQSVETAKENDAVTRKVVRDQQQVQSEPRIQDAPGPGSQPLAGEPAVQPAQPADPPRIQDAPGPAQTLPKAPPSSSPPETAPPAPQF